MVDRGQVSHSNVLKVLSTQYINTTSQSAAVRSIRSSFNSPQISPNRNSPHNNNCTSWTRLANSGQFADKPQTATTSFRQSLTPEYIQTFNAKAASQANSNNYQRHNNHLQIQSSKAGVNSNRSNKSDLLIQRLLEENALLRTKCNILLQKLQEQLPEGQTPDSYFGSIVTETDQRIMQLENLMKTKKDRILNHFKKIICQMIQDDSNKMYLQTLDSASNEIQLLELLISKLATKKDQIRHREEQHHEEVTHFRLEIQKLQLDNQDKKSQILKLSQELRVIKVNLASKNSQLEAILSKKAQTMSIQNIDSNIPDVLSSRNHKNASAQEIENIKKVMKEVVDDFGTYRIDCDLKMQALQKTVEEIRNQLQEEKRKYSQLIAEYDHLSNELQQTALLRREAEANAQKSAKDSSRWKERYKSLFNTLSIHENIKRNGDLQKAKVMSANNFDIYSCNSRQGEPRPKPQQQIHSPAVSNISGTVFLEMVRDQGSLIRPNNMNSLRYSTGNLRSNKTTSNQMPT